MKTPSTTSSAVAPLSLLTRAMCRRYPWSAAARISREEVAVHPRERIDSISRAQTGGSCGHTLAPLTSTPNKEDAVKRLDAKQLPMTAAATSMIAAPAFLVASALISPQLKSAEGAQLAAIAAHPTRWYWFTLLLLIGSVLLIPALLGIAALVHRRSPRLANVGGGLAVVGSLISIGDVMSQFVSWQMVASGADRDQMAALLHRFDSAAGTGVVFSVGGLAVLIGVILLTVGLIRAQVAPAWAAIGLSLATLLNIVAFTSASAAGVALSWVVLLVAMGYIGRSALARGTMRGGAASAAQPRTA